MTQCPLQDIRFLYSFQERLESFGVRDQARFVEGSTTAVTRAVVKAVSSRYIIAQDEAIRKIIFKSRGLICENMAKVQPSDVRSHQSEVVSSLDWSVIRVRILPQYCIITSYSSEPYSSTRGGASKSSIGGIGV